MNQNGDGQPQRNTFSPGPPLMAAQQWQVPPMQPAQQQGNPLVQFNQPSAFPQQSIIMPTNKLYTCERLCGFASPSYQAVVEHEKSCSHPGAGGNATGLRDPSGSVEVVMQLNQPPTEMERHTMRQVLARRCFVPEQSVSISDGAVQSGNVQVTIRVSGSPLTRGQQDAAMDPASLMKEVNSEMAGKPMMPMHAGPIIMSQPAAQLGFAGNTAPVDNQSFGGAHLDMKRTMKDLELHVVVLEALHLPKKDTWGSCDAYVVIKLGQRQTFETHVLKNSLSPHWEEGGNLQLESMTMQNLPPLDVEIWDWDRASENDLIGVGQVPAETLRKLIVDLEEGQILEQKVFIKSNTSDPHRRTGAGEQVKGQDGLDLYVNLELMIFTKDTPEKQRLEEIKRDNDDFHNWIWKSCAGSAYGAFISIAMSQGYVEAMKQAGVMLILTMLIQLTFATQIELNIPRMESASGICGQEFSIFWASLTVYIVYMFENIPNLFQSFVLVIFSREHDRGGHRQRIESSTLARMLVAITAILTEASAWAVQLNAGLRFIITAPDIIGAVRSTVALMFIQGLDEGIFRVCSTPKLRRAVESRKYRVFYGAVFNQFTSEQTIFRLKNYYSQYVHMPLMALVAFLGIIMVRLYISHDCRGLRLAEDTLEMIPGRTPVPAYVFPWDQSPDA